MIIYVTGGRNDCITTRTHLFGYYESWGGLNIRIKKIYTVGMSNRAKTTKFSGRSMNRRKLGKISQLQNTCKALKS